MQFALKHKACVKLDHGNLQHLLDDTTTVFGSKQMHLQSRLSKEKHKVS